MTGMNKETTSYCSRHMAQLKLVKQSTTLKMCSENELTE